MTGQISQCCQKFCGAELWRIAVFSALAALFHICPVQQGFAITLSSVKDSQYSPSLSSWCLRKGITGNNFVYP